MNYVGTAGVGPIFEAQSGKFNYLSGQEILMQDTMNCVETRLTMSLSGGSSAKGAAALRTKATVAGTAGSPQEGKVAVPQQDCPWLEEEKPEILEVADTLEEIGGCFPALAKAWTPRGGVLMQNLRVGDQVRHACVVLQ